MLPPRTVYSLVIRNHTSQKATVVVSYADDTDAVSRKELVVQPNSTSLAPEWTYQSGTAIYAMTITKIAIKASTVSGTPSTLTAPFPAVGSPTQDYPIEIVSKNGAPVLMAKYSE